MTKENKSALVLYQTEDGKTRLEVRLQDETAWLTQKMMADLFQVAVPTINAAYLLTSAASNSISL